VTGDVQYAKVSKPQQARKRAGSCRRPDASFSLSSLNYIFNMRYILNMRYMKKWREDKYKKKLISKITHWKFKEMKKISEEKLKVSYHLY